MQRPASGDETDITIEPGDTAADVIKAFGGSPDQSTLKTRDGDLEFAPDDDLFDKVDDGEKLVAATEPVVG